MTNPLGQGIRGLTSGFLTGTELAFAFADRRRRARLDDEERDLALQDRARQERRDALTEAEVLDRTGLGRVPAHIVGPGFRQAPTAGDVRLGFKGPRALDASIGAPPTATPFVQPGGFIAKIQPSRADREAMAQALVKREELGRNRAALGELHGERFTSLSPSAQDAFAASGVRSFPSATQRNLDPNLPSTIRTAGEIRTDEAVRRAERLRELELRFDAEDVPREAADAVLRAARTRLSDLQSLYQRFGSSDDPEPTFDDALAEILAEERRVGRFPVGVLDKLERVQGSSSPPPNRF